MKDLQPLWVIESELEALLNSLDTCPTDDLRAELEQRITQYLGAEVEKIDRIAGVLSSLDAVAANAKTEIERLRERQHSAEKACQRLAEYVLRVLRQRDGRPLKGHNVTLTLRRSESVVIDDLNQIPDRFKRVTVTTDVPKIPVRDAIKSGQTVPGARLEQHEHLVRK
jgi:hypothetical protein